MQFLKRWPSERSVANWRQKTGGAKRALLGYVQPLRGCNPGQARRYNYSNL